MEYAYRFSESYDLVWWIGSEQGVTLAAEYAALAQPLGLDTREYANQRDIVKAVRSLLQQKGRWLLVFDNVPAPDDVHDYLPPGNVGHVIITSRYSSWRGTANTLEVKQMERCDAIEFILKRTEQDDRESANELAEALGDLPLALEQAAAYIEETGRTLGGYVELFQTHRELLNRGHSSRDYLDTVATTWELAFQQVESRCPNAADLLNMCAFLGPDCIPLDVIRNSAEFLPERLVHTVTDPLALDDAVKELKKYSLVNASGDLLSVHRLVQAVTRNRLGERERELWAETAVKPDCGHHSFVRHEQREGWAESSLACAPCSACCPARVPSKSCPR